MLLRLTKSCAALQTHVYQQSAAAWADHRNLRVDAAAQQHKGTSLYVTVVPWRTLIGSSEDKYRFYDVSMTMRVETGRAAARWACFSSLVLMLAFSASSAVFYPSQGTDAVTNVSILEYSALETHRTGRRLLDATEYAQQTAAAAWRGIEESEALEGTPIPGYLCEGCGFALPTQKRYHLKTLTDALTKLGFDEVAADVPGQWTLYWSFRFPSTLFADLAKDAGRSLRPGQAINHFASMGGLTTKSELWKSFRAARDGVGRDLYDFVPEHVYSAAELQSALAREATQLERVVRSGDAPPRPSWAQGDDEFGRRWVYKKRTHRGVKFVDTAGLAAALDTEGGWDEKTMAARYIEPLLIGGHKFDVGVYVAITSVSPLRVYIHRNVLLRFCKLPYPSTEQLRKGDPPVDSYVVDEYLPPWEIDGLSEFFNVIPTSRVQGTYQIDALRQYLDHRRATGTDPADAQLLSGDEFWARTKRSVVLALLARLPKLKDGARLRDSDDTKKPFFELCTSQAPTMRHYSARPCPPQLTQPLHSRGAPCLQCDGTLWSIPAPALGSQRSTCHRICTRSTSTAGTTRP